jgi:hypothetical protein
LRFIVSNDGERGHAMPPPTLNKKIIFNLKKKKKKKKRFFGLVALNNKFFCPLGHFLFIISSTGFISFGMIALLSKLFPLIFHG